MDVLAELDRRIDDQLALLVSDARAVGSIAPPADSGLQLSAVDARALLVAMLRSRALDRLARDLRSQQRGYYTIGSSGHEMNAVVGLVTRVDDPALLHYRSGAFMLARAARAARAMPGAVDALGVAAVDDTVRSLMAASDDPASGGRHKVWGSAELHVPPQTSTIASHLPKAVGLALALGRPRHLGPSGARPTSGRAGEAPLAPAPLAPLAGSGSVVVCSFGDASFNHASAQAALGAARWARRQGSAVPLLLVCEDNGLGISVPTPQGWIEASVRGMDGITYVRAEGPVDEVHARIVHAVEHVRTRREPVFLHLPTVRLGGHAGSDPEAAYRDRADIAHDLERDPIALAIGRVVALGLLTPEECAAIVGEVRAEVAAAPDRVGVPVPLASVSEVMGPLAPHRPDELVARASSLHLSAEERLAVAARRVPEDVTQPGERTLAARINQALREELARRPDIVLFGEDVGRKGGVYGVTGGLQEVHGPARVHDTLLDETSILGLAQGYGLAGLLPVPEIQYLAYVHNALDQLRGEACSTSFFSDGRFTTPMVVRIAGLGYQRGFGGHFHNDDAVGALRDIPGLALAVPARGDDAVRMLRAALAMAEVDGRVVAFLEPIALYHERDLHQPGDGGWLTDFPVALGHADDLLLPGDVGTYGPEDAEVLVVTYGNGVRMSLRAAERHEREGGCPVRVLDLRWLNPLPLDAVREAVRRTRRLVVVDECRATGGGIADAVLAGLVQSADLPPEGATSVRSHDSYVPIGPAADLVLVGEAEVLAALGPAPKAPGER